MAAGDGADAAIALNRACSPAVPAPQPAVMLLGRVVYVGRVESPRAPRSVQVDAYHSAERAGHAKSESAPLEVVAMPSVQAEAK